MARAAENVTSAFALATDTSPAPYQSNNSPGVSSGLAMNPSSDIVMCVKTLPMGAPRRARSCRRSDRDAAGNSSREARCDLVGEELHGAEDVLLRDPADAHPTHDGAHARVA